METNAADICNETKDQSADYLFLSNIKYTHHNIQSQTMSTDLKMWRRTAHRHYWEWIDEWIDYLTVD